MSNYNFEKKEVTHDNVKFLLARPLKRVIDVYDENLGSVEMSHHEDLGYNIIMNYVSPYPLEVLNLTWMNKEDIFKFDKTSQHHFIEQINVNIDNLEFSHLPLGDNMFNNIQLVVYNNNSSLSAIKQIKNFKTFISKHASAITRGIKLEGFSPIVAMILEKYAKNYALNVVSQKSYNTKNK